MSRGRRPATASARPKTVAARTQDARVDGRGNVVVQIVGDGNSVVAGHAHLELTRYLWRRRSAGDDLQLLHPYSFAIPLVGREPVLEQLDRWLDGPRPISLRVLTAAGGVGKTRLALELCDRATGRAWDAGFATSEEIDRFRAQQNAGTWGWQRPTLIVVDYAAAKLSQVRGWLKELAANGGGSDRPLRMLLLERHADIRVGWFHELVGRGDATSDDIAQLFDPREPIPLPRLTDPADARAVFTAMLRRLRESTGDGPLPAPGPDFDNRVAEVSWGGDPLFLMMAAMTAAQSGVAEALSLSRTDAAFKIADVELGRLRVRAEKAGLPPAFVQHLAAYATLVQGVRGEDVRAVVSGEQQALQRSGAGDPAEIAAVITDALSDGAGGIAPVLPDVIGEALSLRALGEPPTSSPHALAAVDRACGYAWDRAIPTLIRLAQDYGDAAEVDRAPLAWLERAAARASESAQALASLISQLPRETVILRDFAASLTERIVELLRRRIGPSSDVEDLKRLGNYLNDWSLRSSQIGQHGRAVDAAREAVSTFRKLYRADPGTFRPYLAMAVGTLASRLASVGMYQEALEAGFETLELHRVLHRDEPQQYRERLAGTLSNLSNRLGNLGRHYEALDAATEAVSVLRTAVAEDEDSVQHLGVALNSLASRLAKLGRSEEALRASRESVSIYRRLTVGQPDAFRPRLATAINNLANRLNAVGAAEDALAARYEALGHVRALARRHPDAFRERVAVTLNDLASQLASMGRDAEALDIAKNAVDEARKLASFSPGASQETVATALTTLSVTLSLLQRPDEALRATTEALEILRELARRHPTTFEPGLAEYLWNLAIDMIDTGKPVEAFELRREALETILPHLVRAPEVHRETAATMLRGYLLSAEELDRPVDRALTAPIEEALAANPVDAPVAASTDGGDTSLRDTRVVTESNRQAPPQSR